MEKPFIDVGQRIKFARSKKGWTQQQLADVLHVTVQSVSQWETGRTQPELDRLIRLAETLDTHWDWLKTGSTQGFPAVEVTPLGTHKYVVKRYAPVIKVSDIKEHLLNEKQRPPEDLDDNTILATAAGKGRLFSLNIDDDDLAPNLKAGDVAIFDTGMPLRPGDYIVAKPWIEDNPIVRRVTSVALNESDSLIATLSAGNVAGRRDEIDLGDELDRVYGVLVETRRLRPR